MTTLSETKIDDELESYKGKWHPIYKNYFVTKGGRVFSNIEWRGSSGLREITPYKNHKGYLCVALSDNKKRVGRFVHRLVLETFVGLPQPGQVTRHINGVKTDNRAENLAWGTPKENAADVKLHNAQRVASGEESYYKRISRTVRKNFNENPSLWQRGENHGRSRLTDQKAKEILRKIKKQTAVAIAKEYGVSLTTVLNIKHRKTYKHVAMPIGDA